MVKKRRSSSDTEFRFDVPGSPDKACEAPHGAPDSPGSVFLRSTIEVLSPYTEEQVSGQFQCSLIEL
ncbi:GRAM domain-containing protein 3 [Myotis davidii]|uniref:GRAM domain-containing protein 3 n=1 Tax=Myotis davidii TaxID=225400 RepID=L5LW78_MYODS|nr:GRAM domain-containing protein 3 [Myotis davidii]